MSTCASCIMAIIAHVAPSPARAGPAIGSVETETRAVHDVPFSGVEGKCVRVSWRDAPILRHDFNVLTITSGRGPKVMHT